MVTLVSQWYCDTSILTKCWQCCLSSSLLHVNKKGLKCQSSFECCWMMLFVVFLAINCPRLSDDILLLECTENIAAAVKDWVEHAWNAEPIEPLGADAVDFEPSEEWCNVPDVPECNLGKLTSPAHSNTAAEQDCADVIAQVLPKVETLKQQKSKGELQLMASLLHPNFIDHKWLVTP